MEKTPNTSASVPAETFGLMHEHRDYSCTLCGTVRRIATNHTSSCYDDCKGCSWKSDGFGPGMRMGGRIMRLHTYVVKGS